MKLTLWQQFSSNHSSSCFIVGQFETEEQAAQVASEMRQMLQNIVDWWQPFSQDERDEIFNDLLAKGELTPPEQAYKDKYALDDWTSTILLDWVMDQKALDALHHVGRLVSINQMAASISSWDGISPFREIFRKLDGKIMLDTEESDRPLTMNLRGTASTEQVARDVMAQARQEEEHGIWTIALPGLDRTEGEMEVEGHDVIITGYRLYAAANRASYINGTLVSASFEHDFQTLLATLAQLGLTNIQYDIAPRKANRSDDLDGNDD